ncbi:MULTISPECIES: exonuclease domain-containing protein [unclassified Microbacterium]|uniref:exonuclease domain-containing protein n=1 Tax=unclassified Microbacterium TaxID=2609290 RepID=UPI0021A548D2|nr:MULTISPECIES: exonuclease domain-containing protein [unclassified Microbacterium]MCT1365049.1 exonuclease domain-containing protein [Microbacterium sp. p3-SID131]MCT1378287.1 exonuclease domain-containing protein [Microbacterium sp. p3-SID337]
MGWLNKLLGGRAKSGVTVPTMTAPSPRASQPYFAIIDVETTGLSPNRDRVLELAVVRVDHQGQVVDEWSTRFNPEGPVGATHIHGITQADVVRAPLFRDVATSIIPYISGLPIAAHNARFDLSFLRAEFRRAGWDVPWLPAFCTLDGSHHYLPHLERRRLIDCCWSAQIPLHGAHSALGDARATAGLLRHYLQMQGRMLPHPSLLSVPNEARGVVWPTAPSRAPSAFLPDESLPRTARRSRVTRTAPQQPALIAQLTKLSLAEVLDEGAPVGSLTYVETVLDALEDGVISDDEAAALQDLVEMYELSDTDVAAAHAALLLALAHSALDDGRVARDERAQLEAIATALRLPAKLVPSLIAEADAARAARLSAGLGALPRNWEHGDPLRVGDRVVFTGFVERERERSRLEERSRTLGVRVLGTVSGLTAMVVTDGSFAGGKLERAHELGTRIIDPQTYSTLLKHLQPAVAASPKATRPDPREEPAHAGITASASPTTSPGEIRAWGLANGYAVGVRGRLSAELVSAFERSISVPVASHDA